MGWINDVVNVVLVVAFVVGIFWYVRKYGEK